MGPLLALLTGLYEDRVAAIAARGGLVSFLSVLEDRFCHVPQDVIVPGILEAADVSDIVAAQKARPVLLEKFVNGLFHVMSMSWGAGTRRNQIAERTQEGTIFYEIAVEGTGRDGGQRIRFPLALPLPHRLTGFAQ